MSKRQSQLPPPTFHTSALSGGGVGGKLGNTLINKKTQWI